MSDTDSLCINTIRMLAADAVQEADSGHPGMPMGAAPMAHLLWTRFLRHNPANPGWPDRDRFVLSAGHGSMLLYALLHLTGYDLPIEEIRRFRQWNSKTPGHPEFGHTPGVETTTGPLGQGFSNGVGMAMAERILAARFNRPGHTIVDHFTYGIVSDGDLMEGISHEAASLAGHLGLGKLIYLYDDNRISIEGDTDLAFSEDRTARFAAYRWHVQTVEDGNDISAIDAAIDAARAETQRPSLISVRTRIGFGSPKKQGTASAHGEPLGEEELAATKEALGWPASPRFLVPKEALAEFRSAVKTGADLEEEWRLRLAEYEKAHPDLAAAFSRCIAGRLADGWDKDIPGFAPDPKGMATRVASGKVLNAIAPHLPELIGGSADLAPSTKTLIDGEADFQKDRTDGRNLRFGVREHAMGGVLNGMAVHGGLIPYGATFLVFSDYMRPSIRLASLMGLHVIYVMTHDSIGLGEDGPTQFDRHPPGRRQRNRRSLAPGRVAPRRAGSAQPHPAKRADPRPNKAGPRRRTSPGGLRAQGFFSTGGQGHPHGQRLGGVHRPGGRTDTGKGEPLGSGGERTVSRDFPGAAGRIPPSGAARGGDGPCGGGSRRRPGVVPAGRFGRGGDRSGPLRRLSPLADALRTVRLHGGGRGGPDPVASVSRRSVLHAVWRRSGSWGRSG